MLDKLSKISIVVIAATLSLSFILFVIPNFIETITFNSTREILQSKKDALQEVQELEERKENLNKDIAETLDQIEKSLNRFDKYLVDVHPSEIQMFLNFTMRRLREVDNYQEIPDLESTVTNIINSENAIELISQNDEVNEYILWEMKNVFLHTVMDIFKAYWNRNLANVVPIPEYQTASRTRDLYMSFFLENSSYDFYRVEFTPEEQQEFYEIYVEYNRLENLYQTEGLVDVMQKAAAFFDRKFDSLD